MRKTKKPNISRKEIINSIRFLSFGIKNTNVKHIDFIDIIDLVGIYQDSYLIMDYANPELYEACIEEFMIYDERTINQGGKDFIPIEYEHDKFAMLEKPPVNHGEYDYSEAVSSGLYKVILVDKSDIEKFDKTEIISKDQSYKEFGKISDINYSDINWRNGIIHAIGFMCYNIEYRDFNHIKFDHLIETLSFYMHVDLDREYDDEYDILYEEIIKPFMTDDVNIMIKDRKEFIPIEYDNGKFAMFHMPVYGVGYSDGSLDRKLQRIDIAYGDRINEYTKTETTVRDRIYNIHIGDKEENKKDDIDITQEDALDALRFVYDSCLDDDMIFNLNNVMTRLSKEKGLGVGGYEKAFSVYDAIIKTFMTDDENILCTKRNRYVIMKINDTSSVQIPIYTDPCKFRDEITNTILREMHLRYNDDLKELKEMLTDKYDECCTSKDCEEAQHVDDDSIETSKSNEDRNDEEKESENKENEKLYVSKEVFLEAVDNHFDNNNEIDWGLVDYDNGFFDFDDITDELGRINKEFKRFDTAEYSYTEVYMPIINEFMTDDNFIVMKDGKEFVPVKCNSGVYILLQMPENMNDEEELDTELWSITSDDICIVGDSYLDKLDKRTITDDDKWFIEDDDGLDIKVYETSSPIRKFLENWASDICSDTDLYTHNWATDQSSVENSRNTNFVPYETIITCDDNDIINDDAYDLAWVADEIIIYHDITITPDKYLHVIPKLIKVHDYINEIAIRFTKDGLSESDAIRYLKNKIKFTTRPISDDPNAVIKIVQYV